MSVNSQRMTAFRDAYCNWNGFRSIFLTFDVDWAPDYMVGHVLDILDEYEAGATFFATHDSRILRKIAENPRHDVGFHPNISPGSTQGSDLQAVIANLKASYPKAVGNRFHWLNYSYRDLLALGRLGVAYDVSMIYFNTSHLLPTYQHDTNLVTTPYSWEDGVCENQDIPLSIESIVIDTPGLKIINFHPMNVYINSPNRAWRLDFQASCPRILECPEEIARTHRYPGDSGAEVALRGVLEKAGRTGGTFRLLREMTDTYRSVLEST